MKTKVIQSRLDDANINSIQKYAKEMGLSFSMTIRLLLINSIKNIKKNENAILSEQN